MGAFKGLVFMLAIMSMVFNVWLAYIALFVSGAVFFSVLHAFISFGMGFIVYKMYNNGI